jgi:hypothetical protein
MINKIKNVNLSKLDKGKDSLISLITIIFASLISILVLRKLYYCFQSLIWTHASVSIEGLTPWISRWSRPEGRFEIYILYILSFCSIILAFFIAKIIRFVFMSNKVFIKYAICISYSVLTILLLINYSTKVPAVFHTSIPQSMSPLMFSFIILIILISLMYLQKKLPKTMMIMICITLLPIVFVAFGRVVSYDYSCIFFPALRWNLGVNVSDICFGYGILISFFAMLWMKAGISLGSFYIVLQLSNYILLITMYLVSRRIFQNKTLPLLFIFSLVLIKVYFHYYGLVNYVQWSSLRLDLWILLFLIIFFKGPFNWLVGIVCGFLIIFSHNFGLIYTIAYVELILFLVLISLIDRKRDSSLIVMLKRQLNKISIPIVLIGISLILFKFYFNSSQQALSLGIGVSKIPDGSFFWIYLIILPIASLLLFDLRVYISSRYFELGFSLVFLSVGNLIYFFGQSTEMHIYLSGMPLLFLLFFIFDLMRIKTSVSLSKFKFMFSNIDVLLSLFLILIITFLCSDNIINKLRIQYNKITNSQKIFDAPFLAQSNKINLILSDINSITNNSKRLQFFTLGRKESYTQGTDTAFLLYYHTKIIPLSFLNHMFAFAFLDPLILHMQGLINNGYYLLVTADLYKEIFESRLKGVDLIYPIQDKYVLISASNWVKYQKEIVAKDVVSRGKKEPIIPIN